MHNDVDILSKPVSSLKKDELICGSFNQLIYVFQGLGILPHYLLYIFFLAILFLLRMFGFFVCLYCVCVLFVSLCCLILHVDKYQSNFTELQVDRLYTECSHYSNCNRWQIVWY